MKIFLLSALFLLGAIDVSAQGYKPLAPIPQLTQNGSTSSSFFLQNLVPLLISIAGGLAVIRIVIGGVQYMTTDAWNGKADAKSTIQQALLGLLLAMASYTILYTLNPDLLNIKIAPASQNVGGESLGTDGLTTGNLGPTELGCTDCEELKSQDIAIRPGACSNTPCYAKNDLVDELTDLYGWLRINASSTYRAFQITKAFPNNSSTSSLDTCFRLNQDGTGYQNAGTCVDVSLTVQDVQRIKGLLDGVVASVGDGYRYEFLNACGTRQAQLRGSPLLNQHSDNLFLCRFPNRGEFLRIYRGDGPAP